MSYLTCFADGRGPWQAARQLTRWALLKNPHRLTDAQRTTLAGIQTTNGPLYRAYLLKDRDAAGAAVAGR